jgi:hypothetical protein
MPAKAASCLLQSTLTTLDSRLPFDSAQGRRGNDGT